MAGRVTISEIVPLLAHLLDRSALPRSAVQSQAISHLKAIPDYVSRGCLDQWDADFPWASTQDGSDMAGLLEDVFELGRANLYTLFNGDRTLREYATVGAKFLQAGLSPPPQVDGFTGW